MLHLLILLLQKSNPVFAGIMIKAKVAERMLIKSAKKEAKKQVTTSAGKFFTAVKIFFMTLKQLIIKVIYYYYIPFFVEIIHGNKKYLKTGGYLFLFVG